MHNLTCSEKTTGLLQSSTHMVRNIIKNRILLLILIFSADCDFNSPKKCDKESVVKKSDYKQF